ncbi:hypothetical protein EON65_27920 [archaeon]|nr:MAG: hypothetical protein EON65_27920 [archaeon]
MEYCSSSSQQSNISTMGGQLYSDGILSNGARTTKQPNRTFGVNEDNRRAQVTRGTERYGHSDLAKDVKQTKKVSSATETEISFWENVYRLFEW